MAKADVGKLKEQALKAVEKRSYAKAAELYVQIALAEGEPDWRQRAGEALRKAGDVPGATEQFSMAAEGYAQGGFLLKAIAVCKVVLMLDPRHTSTQAMLTELYARREGGSRTPSGQIGVMGGVAMGRSQSGSFQMVAEAKPTPPAPAAFAPRRAAPPPEVASPEESGPPAIEIEAIALDLPRTLPPGAPMEVVPLHEVLGGRKSGDFSTVESAPAAYEIELGDDDFDMSAVAEAAEAAVATSSAPTRAPAPPPAAAAAPAAAPPRDELDFSGLLDDEAAKPTLPAAPPSPAAPSPTTAARPTPPVAPVAAPLRRIPLFSSLTPDRLHHLIQHVELRQVAPGEAIVRQGERGGSLFVIASGRVEVTAGGDASALAHLGEGQFFGELSLLTDSPRSATVTAEEPTELLEISRELVSEIVASSPEVLKTLLRFFRDRLLDRLLSTSPLFTSLSAEDARGLVAHFKFLELEPKVQVVREGERAPGLFLLLCGKAQVVKSGFVVAPLGPGDLFGEMSLLTRGPATATIETAGKCWALELPAASFQEIMVTYPQILEYVSELAASRQAESAERVEFL